jgi:hypothetical protein
MSYVDRIKSKGCGGVVLVLFGTCGRSDSHMYKPNHVDLRTLTPIPERFPAVDLLAIFASIVSKSRHMVS